MHAKSCHDFVDYANVSKQNVINKSTVDFVDGDSAGTKNP